MSFFYGLIAKLLASGLDAYLKKHAVDEQAKQDYITFIDMMSRRGLLSVQSRLESADTIEAARKLWEHDDKP